MIVNRMCSKLFTLTGYLFFLMIFVFVFRSGLAAHQITAIPNDRNPKKIILENDSLVIHLNLDWDLAITSWYYKSKMVEFVQKENPMPLLQIDNPWILHNVQFTLMSARFMQKSDSSVVLIDASSNYIENPFHLYIRLGLAESPRIDVRIRIENKYREGYHDMYRRKGVWVTPGLPWLSYLSPGTGGITRLFYFTTESMYVLENVTDPLVENITPSEDHYFQPVRKPVIMSFYDNPMLPVLAEFATCGCTFFIEKRDSKLDWNFATIKEALWPHNRLRLASNESALIFDGSLGVYAGDWHKGFQQVKNQLRRDFDFTYYNRPGCAKYKRDFIAYHSFIFNHTLFDAEKNTYRIKEFLEKSQQEYGGFDQFYFWHAYPRVGTDPRDQFDLYYDLPGGLDSLAAFVQTAHTFNTHIYLAYNPWDIIGKKSDMYGEMAEIVHKVNADGLLLDTMGESDTLFREKLDRYNPDAQFVTEGRPDINGIVVTSSSWDHQLTREAMPIVDLLRFIFPEHRVYHINRWDRDRLPLIKKAIFNATGYTVWDDVFGEINLHSVDEKNLLYRYHAAARDLAHVLNAPDNEPMLETCLSALYVNGFFSSNMHVYTLYQDDHNFVTHHKDNRIIGPLFPVKIPDNWHIVDIWNLRPVDVKVIDAHKFAFLPDEMPEDIGCFIAMPQLIQITRTGNTWTAGIPGGAKGTLELAGADIAMRKQIVKTVNADSALVFNKASANSTLAGHVIVQYRNENMEVCDAAIIKVGF